MESRTFSKTIVHDPAYFGAYLNMARHNILLVENHLDQKFNRKDLDDLLKSDEKITDSFLTRERKDNPNHLYSELIRYMPCCSIYDPEFMVTNKQKKEDQEIIKKIEEGKDFKSMPIELKAVFKDLNKLRNDFTHYGHADPNWQRRTIVSDTTKTFLLKVFENAIRYCYKRFKGVISEDEFSKLRGLKLFEIDNNLSLNQDGLVFLTCIFLEREYMFYFINQVKTLKNATNETFKAKRELFGAFSLRLPHEKISSDNPRDALFQDILNELVKIPKEIFNHLSPENKKGYRPDFDEDREQKITENSIREDEDDLETYLQDLQSQYRRGQRFYYLAVKLIDELGMLPEFKFQIRLGKYVKKSGTKKFGNESVLREISGDVYGFGRLPEFLAEEIVLKTINVDNIATQRFENFAPTFDLRANKCQIKFFKGSDTDLDVEKINKDGKCIGYAYSSTENQVIGVSIYELYKILILEYFKPKEANNIIKDFIKRKNKFIFNIEQINKVKNELNINEPKYRQYEDKKTPKDRIENHKQIVGDRKSKLNGFLKEYDLDCDRIPRDLVDYLIDIKPSNRDFTLVRKIKEIKNEARQKVSDYDEFIRPKIGEMATEISKDIVDMTISLDIKERFTSFYYDKMQEALALFADPEKRKVFAQIITDLNLWDSQKGHPFLNKINFDNFKKTGEFYRAYYYAKAGKKGEKGKDESWMYKTFYKFDKETRKTKIVIPKIYLEKDNWKNNSLPHLFTQLSMPQGIINLDDWVQKFNKNSIDLPTNLFDERLTQILNEELKKKDIYVKGNEKISILLKKWYQSTYWLQDFYNLEKEYMPYEKKLVINGIEIDDKYKTKIEKIAHDISVEKQNNAKQERQRFDLNYTKQQIKQLIHQVITHNEKDIRKLQETDIALLLHVKAPFEVKDLSKIKTFLDEETEFEEKIHNKIITAKRKRKDYGLLRKIKHDKRLESLFTYIDDDKIPFEKLREMLKDYNDLRVKVFEEVFKLEKLVLENYKEEVLKYQPKNEVNSNIKHEPYLTVLAEKGLINSIDKDTLKNFRDKFSHNQLPLIDEIDKSKIMESLYEWYTSKIKDVI